MAGKSKGKTIEITVKSTQLPDVDAKDDPELLNLLVEVGKLVSLKTEESSFKMKVETISHQQDFLNSLKTKFGEAGIDDVTVAINSKLVF